MYRVDTAFDGCWTRSSEVTVRNFKKLISFVVLPRKQNTAHQTAERIYTQDTTCNLPVPSCQEPWSTRVYRTEKRDVVVSFRCRHDVKIPRSAVMGEFLGYRKNVLVLHWIEMAQNARATEPQGGELTDSIQPSSPSSPCFPSLLTTMPLTLASKLLAARSK